MIKDYEDFKKFILQSTTIDLNAYKERQMKRRIDTLIILRLMYLNFTAIRRFGRRLKM